jgi:transcriptional/translational regulatory protein YebC/TACO1
MSGHSKWATTKHKKAVIDAKRGKLFAKLIKNIEVAARTGGGDPSGNPTLYDAIQKAKKTSVPNDNIDRAVKRGSGAEGGGVDYQTITYEGYAPGGVAVLVECLTDNRNRAASDVRTAMTRNGGSMADPGSVAYLFTRKGVVIVPKAGTYRGRRADRGARRGRRGGQRRRRVVRGGQRAGRPGRGADLAAGRRHRVRVGRGAVHAERDRAAGRGRRPPGVPLVEALEDLDDVQDVYANFDVSDEVLALVD